MKLTLRLVGIFGITLFGALFLVTFLSPEKIESSAKGFVQAQIEKEVREKQSAITDNSVASKAKILADKLGLESDRIQEDLANNLPEKIAAIIASLCGYDCERQKAVAQSITLGYLDRLKNIQLAQNTLGEIVKGKYLEIVGNLKFDLRIFLGANCGMFIILLLISLLKPQAAVHLYLPGILLLAATLVASGIYIFGQDWFYTILYNDYMGFGYLAYLSIIFALFVDIVMNKAKVTCEAINAIANLVGSAFSALPC